MLRRNRFNGCSDSCIAGRLQIAFLSRFLRASSGEEGKRSVEKITAYLGAKDLKFVEIPFLKELGWLWTLGTEKKGCDTCHYFNVVKTQ